MRTSLTSLVDPLRLRAPYQVAREPATGGTRRRHRSVIKARVLHILHILYPQSTEKADSLFIISEAGNRVLRAAMTKRMLRFYGPRDPSPCLR